MIDHTSRLPPLNALRVFHVVVRHKSFRAAADELVMEMETALEAASEVARL